jgi:hypothetical protein
MVDAIIVGVDAIDANRSQEHDREGTMVTPEYARAYIDEITRLAHPTARNSRSNRASLGGLLRRLSR